MDANEFKARTKAFAVRVFRLVDTLPETKAAQVVARQLLRCSSSVGANYRAACRAVSRPSFAAKISIAEEECDETIYWLELLIETGIVNEKRLGPLLAEARELLGMLVASEKTSRRNKT